MEDKNTTKEEGKKEVYNSKITKEDMNALRKRGLSMDSGDDRLLQEREEHIDFSGKDLDIPGRDAVHLTPSAGITDEENTLFAQGSEHNENLETSERSVVQNN